jgi:hypothetical protein
MLTHIVMMRFKDRDPQIPQIVKEKLLTLPAQIAEIKHYEVGINIVTAERNYDLVLVSKFDSLDTLHAYSVHPAHVEVLGYIRSVLETAAVVDYL